jgi:hypothetical protein
MYHSSYQERRGEPPVADNRSYFRQKGLECIHTYNIYIYICIHTYSAGRSEAAVRRDGQNSCMRPSATSVCGLKLRVLEKRCNQIKIMPFIQTCLAQSQSASPKATMLYVHNMSLFLVACLLNRWQRASSARCLDKKTRGLTTPRSSKPLCRVCFNAIAAEIEVSKRSALRQHSC